MVKRHGKKNNSFGAKKRSLNKLILIGGSRGVGKHALAKRIQSGLGNTIIINKDGASGVLTKALLDIYGKRPNDKVSPEYLYKVEPLEYKQLFLTIEHMLHFNSCNIVVIAQFFNQFSEKAWIESIEKICENNGFVLELIFLKKSPSCTSSKKPNYFRENERLRTLIDSKIRTISNMSLIEKYTTEDVFRNGAA